MLPHQSLEQLICLFLEIGGATQNKRSENRTRIAVVAWTSRTSYTRIVTVLDP